MPKRETFVPDGGRVRIWMKRPPPAVGYTAAVVLSALGQLVRPLLHPHLMLPYVPFMVIAGAFGGLGPGLLATVLCMLESIFFAGDLPRDTQGWLGAGALALTGLLTSLVFEELKSDAERLRRAYTELAASHAESRLVEEKLSEAHRDMVSILESILDGFNVFDREWRYTYVNAAAARMVHKTPEELLGKKLWDVWPHA
jgi:PAS domain-containing protein